MPITRRLFALLTILGMLSWAHLAPVIAAESAAMPTVLITGANRGIGIEFAKQYAERGWIVIASCRNPDSAKDLQALQRNHENLQLVQIDLVDSAGIDQFAQSLNGKPIDVLINNAALLGDLKTQLFGQIDYVQFTQILAVNAIGTMKLSESLTPNIRLGTQKKIITLGSSAGSIASINGNPDLYAYRASKAALHLLMRNLSFELADDGIVVGIINPGLVDTRGFAEMLAGTKPIPPEFQQIVNLLKAGVIQLSTPEAAVTDMIALIDELAPEQSGVFLNADGTPLPW
jgi:NAD(P)-dependent dehydrogenase (short-subunit alcohol dehydrogenase family)